MSYSRLYNRYYKDLVRFYTSISTRLKKKHMFRDLADKPKEVLKQTPQHPGIADSKMVKS